MKGLMVAVVLAFMAATIAPAIAEVVGGGTQLAQAPEGKKKKAAKPVKAHKAAKKPAPKAHKGDKKGKKAA